MTTNPGSKVVGVRSRTSGALASSPIGIGRSGSIRLRRWHCAGDSSSSAASAGRLARCERENLTSSCHASQVGLLDLAHIGVIIVHDLNS